MFLEVFECFWMFLEGFWRFLVGAFWVFGGFWRVLVLFGGFWCFLEVLEVFEEKTTFLATVCWGGKNGWDVSNFCASWPRTIGCPKTLGKGFVVPSPRL